MTFKKVLLIGTGLILLQMLGLHLFGQPPICECGFVKLWEWDVWSSGMSQHISD